MTYFEPVVVVSGILATLLVRFVSKAFEDVPSRRIAGHAFLSVVRCEAFAVRLRLSRRISFTLAAGTLSVIGKR
jgi:hypothetical protein